MAEWIYLLNGFTYLAVAFITFYIFYTTFNRKFCRIGPLCCMAGVLALLNGTVNVVWFTGYMAPTAQDSTIIGTVFSVCLAILFSLIAYRISEDKIILYLLGLFIVALSPVFLKSGTLVFVAMTAYLFLLVLNIDIILFHHGVLKKAGYFGIGYSASALFFTYQVIQGHPAANRWWFVSFAFLFFVFYYILQHTRRCKQRILLKAGEDSTFVKYLKLCLFTLFFTAYIFFSTSLIHEFGHVLVSKAYGCGYESITYVIGSDSFGAYASVVCTSGNLVLMALGGVIFTILVGFIFFLMGGFFCKYMGCLLFGFGALITNKDFLFLGLSDTLIFIINFLGALVVLWAIVKMVHLYTTKTTEERYLYCKESKSK